MKKNPEEKGLDLFHYEIMKFYEDEIREKQKLVNSWRCKVGGYMEKFYK